MDMNNFILNEKCCSKCGTPFQEGDAVYKFTDWFDESMADESEVLCKECSALMGDDYEDFRFRDGKARRIYTQDMNRSLGNNLFALIRNGKEFLIEPADPEQLPADRDILEINNSSATLLFAEQLVWDREIFLLEAYSFPVLNKFMSSMQHVMIDSKGCVAAISEKERFQLRCLKNSPRRVDSRWISLRQLCTMSQKYQAVIALREALADMKPQDLLEFFQERIQGQGTELKKAVYLIWKYLQNVASCKPFVADNWLLTAPSGSGKTEFFRTLRDFLKQKKIPLPVVQIDMSKITEEGFKGQNPSSIPKKILAEYPHTGGYGICFLDEADKKLVPSYESHGKDVNAYVQGNLLTMLEGEESTVELDSDTVEYDSGKTMFVLMGAFQSLRDEKQEAADKKSRSFGFTPHPVDEADLSETFYEPLSMEDVIAFGMQEELAGRLTQIINFRRLSREDMRLLLRDKAKIISRELGCTIELSEAGEEWLLSISFGNLGIRQPMNKIREQAQNAIAEVFFDSGFDPETSILRIEDAGTVRIISRTSGNGKSHKGFEV